MKKLQVIGLAGTNGSGKDTIGHLLVKSHGYMFVTVTDLLRAEAARRSLKTEREVLRAISSQWRRELGLGVLVDKAIAEYEKNADDYEGVVIASLRNPGEADRIHEFDGTMLWIDGDPRIRYERIQANASQRNRAEEDNKSFAEFQAEELIEMYPPVGSDSASLNMSEVKNRCDATIINDTQDLDVLQQAIELVLDLRKSV
jgi:cytidylate kinase